MPLPPVVRRPAPAERRRFTLGGIFLLTATCAIIARMWQTLVARAIDSGRSLDRELFPSLAMALVAALLGGFAGLWIRPRRAHALQGAGAGLALGLILGPLVFARDEDRNELTTVLFVGAAVLVVLAVVLQRVSKRTTHDVADDVLGPAAARSLAGESKLPRDHSP